MPHATLFATQWAGIVAQLRLFGAHAPDATLIEADGMVAAVMPAAPTSSLLNAALTVDPRATPERLEQLSARYRAAGAKKWGLWLDGRHEQGARAAQQQGMVLDSRPTPMVADLDRLPFDEAPASAPVDLATIGRVNDLAYAYPEPKLEPAIRALQAEVHSYGARHAGAIASVAMAYDAGEDTAVWLVATLPSAQRKGLGSRVLRRLLLDARGRGRRTASLQASSKGRPLYERLGFEAVGSLHLYEERFS
jgi:GNAT superfamily N-acetyltransferase